MQNQHFDKYANFTASNFSDDEGIHFGGCSYGDGFVISWQRGPVIDGQQNGAFLSDVVAMAIHQLEYVNDGKFQCEENEDALNHLRLAAEAMQRRKDRRVAEGTSGTHKA